MGKILQWNYFKSFGLQNSLFLNGTSNKAHLFLCIFLYLSRYFIVQTYVVLVCVLLDVFKILK